MKSRAGVFLLLVFCTSLFADDQRVHIGAILPLSGEAAGLGAPIKNGITLAYEELNAELRNRIDLVFEDDRMAPAEAVKAFSNLNSLQGVNMAISGFSGQGNALAPVVDQKGGLLISISSDPKISKGRDRCFSFMATPEQMGKTSAAYLRKMGFKRLVYAGNAQEGMLALKRELLRELGPGYSFLVEEDFDSSTTDFRSYISKLKGKEPLDVIVLSFTSNHGTLARQLAEQGVSAPIFSLTSLENRAEIGLSRGALIGQHYVSSKSADPGFALRYEKRFPGASLLFAANGYDALKLLAAAIEPGNRDPRDVAAYLSSLRDYHGTLGIYSADGEHRFTLPAAVKIVKESSFEELDPP